MSVNPFPGPRPYSANERARFFARDAVVKKLANQVLARRATTLFGPSGAGKSSLMQAGVIPMLQEAQEARVVSINAWPVQTPPLQWLVNQIYLDYELGELSEGKTLLEALQNGIDLAWRENDCPMLMVLDQVEQLFVNERDAAEVEHLCEALSWLIDPGRIEDVHVVLSLREDYLGRLRDITRERPELSVYGFRVAPLSVGEMVLAMCRTAKEGEPAQDWDEQGIRSLMLDVRVPGQRATDGAEVQTAFGQIVCRALWEERAAGRDVRGADAEAILRRYLDMALAELGPLQGLAQQLLEEHLIDKDGHRRLLTEKEARLVLGEATEVLDRLDAARVLRAEEHQGSRYFELGHDWLAKKVLEGRKRREEARRQDELEKERAARKKFEELEAIARQERDAAIQAQKEATERREEAVRATLMAGARELLASGQPSAAALVLASIDKPERVRGWTQFAVDLVCVPGPHSTRSHEAPASHAVWSPDGRWIVAIAENVAYLWRADGRGDAVVLKGHKNTLTSAAFSQDGQRIVTASRDNTARVWRIDGNGEPVVLEGHENGVTSAWFSPDGQRIATASRDGTVRVWRASGSGETVVLRGHDHWVLSALFSQDGQRILTASADKTARLWRVDDQSEPLVFRGHEDWVTSAAFSPNEQWIVTASQDKTVRVWSAYEQARPHVLRGHEARVNSVAFSPDGKRIVSASADKTVRVWGADGTGDVVMFGGHAGQVHSAAFSPDGKHIVSASADKTVRMWRTHGVGDDAVVLKGHVGGVNSAVFSPDGTRIVSASADHTIRVWRVVAQTGMVTLRSHDDVVTSAAFSPNGEWIATTSMDETARVWSANGQGNAVVLRGHEHGVYSAAFSPNGQRLVTASWDTTARVWQVDGSGDALVLRGHEYEVNSASFSPDGQRIVTASRDATAWIWPADGHGNPIVLRNHESGVNSAMFSPDGQRIVTTSRQTVWVWRMGGQESPVRLAGHADRVNSASFSPDGMRIVSASWDKTVRVWSADGKGEPVVLEGHEGAVNSAAYSTDGQSIVSASVDKTVRVWRVDGRSEPLVLKGHQGAVNAAAFSPDGQRIVTASSDGTARIWPISIPLLQQALRNATTDCLTPAQRQTYLLENESDARKGYEQCERSYDRTPLPNP